jgi:uracil-DNA glycosylase family 4
MAKKKRRRIIRDLDSEHKKARGRLAQTEIGHASMYPLDAPGMPAPGVDFVNHAMRLGEQPDYEKVTVVSEKGRSRKVDKLKPGEILEELYRSALREVFFELPVEVKRGTTKNVSFIPGHIWGEHRGAYVTGQDLSVTGPRPADVMVLGKMPGKTEVRDGRNMVGESGEILLEILRELKVTGMGRWYITNLCKFRPPDGSSRLKAGWLKDCMPLLHQELRLVRPRYILCLGADASKALLGKKYSVGYMEGRVIEYEYPVHLEDDDPEKEVLHKSLVMTVTHPAQVARAPEMRRVLERGLARFNLLKRGIRFDKEEEDIDHREIRTLEQLRDLLKEIENDPLKTDRMYAVDAEWHGEHPQNKRSYVRTVQFAWRPKHACAIVLRAPGGKISFKDEDGKPAIKRAMKLLTKFFKGKRICGHFLVSDLEWLVPMGLDLREQFAAPLEDLNLVEVKKSNPKLWRFYCRRGFGPKDVVPAWFRTRYEGGADTGLMAHAAEETASLGLESLALRYTTVPRYDVPLHDWRARYCAEHGLKAKDLDGYGECPDEILVPYGIYDADGTLRLFYELDKLIDRDYEGNCCREAFWESMIALPAILEMHQNGIAIDKKRLDFLTEAFMSARGRMELTIQQWAKWPEFNVRSVQQVREFLFGEALNGKVTEDGRIVAVRPDGAESLFVEPLMDTSKPPMPWWKVKDKGLVGERNPSTNKSVLAILAQDNEEVSEQINWIRDYRFLDQVLKSVLRPPVTDDAGQWVEDAGTAGGLGGLVFDAGLASVICDDGRVRTHIYPTADTGRWKSARPPLQNLSKQRDSDYYRMLGDRYKYKLRTIMRSKPGHVLVESDLKGAELYGMAIMANDETMINHAQRNQLPDEGYDEYGNEVEGGKHPHPDFYDIHSNVAVFAFKLDCVPTKAGLKSIGRAHLRVIAKNVIFGIAYGRGAKAIALQAKEQGVITTVEEVENIIAAIFEMYSGLTPFFDECRRRCREEGWLCNCFGRFRRFGKTDDFKLQGDFERVSMNFPIQSMIASAMDRAVAQLAQYREEVGDPEMYRMLLAIHDAVLLEVPYNRVERVIDEVLPTCMIHRVPIYPTTLDGMPNGEGPYYMGIDSEVMEHWGEGISKARAAELCIPEVTTKGIRIAH